METGTGKTYVYLRTIFELSQRYGFQKFIVVVPSVAIREGVLKNIEITAEHFRALYNNLPFEHFVYDARKVNRLRQFATSNTLQILVINIDAFRSRDRCWPSGPPRRLVDPAPATVAAVVDHGVPGGGLGRLPPGWPASGRDHGTGTRQPA